MEATVKVKSLTHNELVDIFSTAFYGCDWLQVDYDHEEYKKIPEENRKGDCYEDKLADLVLNGKSFKVYDLGTCGEVYGKFGKVLETNEAEYEITLERILKGCSTKQGAEYLCELLWEDGDYFTANNLMQIVMFGEVIYG